MQFLTPAALALLALAIPILLLWMLKLRRRDVTVSSTMLWSRLLRDREANAPWQKLRRNLLLWLQLLILLALVFSLARPVRPVPVVASGAVVLLLDSSASMQATDVPPSRFAVAQQVAEELAGRLGNDGQMTVIAVGRQPRILAAATSDQAVLRQAIAGAQVEAGTADWSAALALAAGAVRGAAETTTVIISDGNLPADLPTLPGEVRYVPIGQNETAGNDAITALAVRDGANGPELLVALNHFGPLDRVAGDPQLAIYLDNVLFDSRRVHLQPDQTSTVTLGDLPAGVSLVEARLTSDDALALDNRAWAIHRSSGEKRVLVVSAGNLFLERAIANLPGAEAFRSDPAAELPLDYDLYVLDGTVPADLPAAPTLLINPPPGNGLLTVNGVFSQTQVTRVANDSLLQHVEWNQVQILQATAVELPSWANVLVRAEGGPLLLAGETGGRRVAALTFDLHQSDLPLQVAFPVLMSNLVEWLLPGAPFDDPGLLLPGDALVLHPGRAAEYAVIRPDGRRDSGTPGDNSATVYDATNLPGVYQVELDGAPAGQFAVNLFDPAESDLGPQAAIRVGQTELAPAGQQVLGQQALWPWLLVLALLVLLLEWWVYHQGSGKIKPPAFKWTAGGWGERIRRR